MNQQKHQEQNKFTFWFDGDFKDRLGEILPPEKQDDDFSIKDFAIGWLQGTNVIGRPAGIIVADDGSLFVSDDNAGKIYRISYQK